MDELPAVAVRATQGDQLELQDVDRVRLEAATERAVLHDLGVEPVVMVRGRDGADQQIAKFDGVTLAPELPWPADG